MDGLDKSDYSIHQSILPANERLDVFLYKLDDFLQSNVSSSYPAYNIHRKSDKNNKIKFLLGRYKEFNKVKLTDVNE